MKKEKLMLGDNIESLKKLPENSIDSVVTDGPYGLSFMNKKWDYDVPSVEFWKEVYRVLKPGGHLLSFGGTRTYHRMVVNIEDAGFEIRDQIQWLYGSGFPKSLNVGKAVDKRGGQSVSWFGEWLLKWRTEKNIAQSKIAELFPSKTGGLTGCVSNWELGNNLPTNEQFNLICKTFNLPFTSLEEAERVFVGTKTSGIGKAFTKDGWGSGKDEVDITKGQSEWEGWGSALKPANEPICLARKPLSEKSIAENVLKWKTGGINVDGCRIGTDDIKRGNASVKNSDGRYNWNNGKSKINQSYEPDCTPGRFPSNLILDESAAEMLDEQSGVSKSQGGKGEATKKSLDRTDIGYGYKKIDDASGLGGYGDKGGASRFFYVAKVSKAERNMGLDEFEEKELPHGAQDKCGKCNKQFLAPINSQCICEEPERLNIRKKNTHPTVKPVNLMSYLCKLITPPNGIVLDPFMGSGSTGIAALLNDFRFVGMEMDNDYFKIAESRINSYEDYRKFLKK